MKMSFNRLWKNILWLCEKCLSPFTLSFYYKLRLEFYRQRIEFLYEWSRLYNVKKFVEGDLEIVFGSSQHENLEKLKRDKTALELSRIDFDMKKEKALYEEAKHHNVTPQEMVNRKHYNLIT